MNERRNDPGDMIGIPRIASQIPNSDRSPLYDVRNPARASREGRACEVMFRGRNVWPVKLTVSIFNSIWWSQTGSNRRPHACKARALPAELWPRTRRRMLKLDERHIRSIKVVGLGRLELPTSRLSSARSNQLSYKPLTTEEACSRAPARRRMHRTSASPWRVFVREERETKTAKSRQWSSTILKSLAPDVSKTIR